MTIIKLLGLLQSAAAFGHSAGCAVRVPSVSLLKSTHYQTHKEKCSVCVSARLHMLLQLPRLLAWIKLLF